VREDAAGWLFARADIGWTIVVDTCLAAIDLRGEETHFGRTGILV
jgi:hypothetical protein